MPFERKSTFCKCVEIETIAYRTNQLALAHVKIAAGLSPEETDLLDMSHMECLAMAMALPDESLPQDIALAAFTFCRWFLNNATIPDFIVDLENAKKAKHYETTKTFIFSKLHLLDSILKAGDLNDTVYVEHCYFISDDHCELQYTFCVAMHDANSIGLLLDKYVTEWPDAKLLGIGSNFRTTIEEIKNDDKTNMILEEVYLEHGALVKELINKNVKNFS